MQFATPVQAIPDAGTPAAAAAANSTAAGPNTPGSGATTTAVNNTTPATNVTAASVTPAGVPADGVGPPDPQAPTAPGGIDTSLPTSVTNATAPTVDTGLIAGAMKPAPQVQGSNVSGNVAQAGTTDAVAADAGLTQASNGQANQTNASTTNWNVNPDSTVQGQLQGIIAANSPLMQRAANAGDESANARGLYNSTLGVQAAQAALYDAALPVAQQDAQVNAQSGQFNAAAANSTSQFNAGQANQTSQFNTGLNANTSQFNTGQANTNAQFNASEQTQVSGANAAAANQAALSNAASTNQAHALDAQTSLQAQTSNQSAAVQQSAQQYDAAVKVAMQNADASSKLQLQQIDAQTRDTLARIQAQYNVQMQTSSSMSQSYQSLVDNITKVMQDPNLDAPGKQQDIANLTSSFNAGMQLQSSISGLNLGSLLSSDAFSTQTASSSGPNSSAAIVAGNQNSAYPPNTGAGNYTPAGGSAENPGGG